MGFFSFVKSVASFVGSTAKATFQVAKEYAGKALGWLADNGERLVEGVKETWRRISPILKLYVKPFMDAAEKYTKEIPWVGKAVLLINKGLGALLALENSPVLKKLEKAILWSVEMARKYKDYLLSEEEKKEVEEQKKALHEAALKLNDAEQRKAFSLAEMIHDFVLIRSAVERIFTNNSVTSLDHYLRLRATQKLLNEAQNKIEKAVLIEDISNDDIFLLQVATNLISDSPVLADREAERLEVIVDKRFGKSLIVFVFEEMVMAWGSSLESLEREWSEKNQSFSKDRTLLRRLEQEIKLGSELDAEDAIIIKELRKSVPAAENSLDEKADLILARKKYIYASEGLLQVLENSDIEEHLIDGARKVGELVINLAQENKGWSDLNEEQQSIINDYAIIFEEDSKVRAEKLVKVGV